ncbi:MAG: HlyD family secretion protein [Candidatus Baltobacteraceae bacterium]
MLWFRSHRRESIVAVAVVALVLLIALLLGHRAPHGIAASGTIEATQSDVASKVEGRLTQLRVHDGEAVHKGQVLAVLESLDPTLRLDQSRAALRAAQAQVVAARAAYRLQEATYAATLAQAGEGVAIARSNLGTANETYGIERHVTALALDQAEAQLLAARATYTRTKVDYERDRNLVATGDIAKQVLDDARNAYASASAQLQAQSDAVALARANLHNVQIRRFGVLASRSQQGQAQASFQSAQAEHELVRQRAAQLADAKAQVAQAQAQVGLALDQLHETDLLAPFDGVVLSHNFEVGDLIEPGAAVLTIGDLLHPYLYVYVGETDLPHIKTGMAADATVDGMPGTIFHGKVTEIATNAEFTPENVQTKAERIDYLVFRVKIQFTDTTGTLKPGLPADAVIHG